MRVKKEELDVIKRTNNRVLVEVLEKALGDEIDNLKLANDLTYRYIQGKVFILEDIIKLVSH